MPHWTTMTLAELRAASKADIIADVSSWLNAHTKKQIVELLMDADEFTDRPIVETGEHGILTREQTVQDALGEVLYFKKLVWTYYVTGEVDEIITIIESPDGDEVDDAFIEHYLDKQPTSRSVLTVVLAPQETDGITAPFPAEYWKLTDTGSHAALWAVNAKASVCLDLHAELWAISPTETFGVLGVASSRGNFFLPAAVRYHTQMTIQQALVRRDKIADYLDSINKDTSVLRAATDEHEQIEGIVTALGYMMAQLWSAMRG